MLPSIHPSIYFYTCFIHTWVAGVCWSLSPRLVFPSDENTLSQWGGGLQPALVSVFTAPLSDALLSAITHSVCHPSVSLPSLSSHAFLFSTKLSQLYRPLRLCVSSPSHIVLSSSLFFLFLPPICFLFSTVSGTPLLCFSSSDPTLEHLREIRRKLASENLQLRAPVPHLLSGSQLSDQKTFRATRATEKRADRLRTGSLMPPSPAGFLRMRG